MNANRKNLILLLINTLFFFVVFVPSGAQVGGSDMVNLKSARPDLVQAYDKIEIFAAWDLIRGLGDVLSPVTVGFVDTGVDSGHPEFAGVNFGRSSPFALIDHAADDGRPAGHGTQIAGIIGANNVSLISPYVFPRMNGLLSGPGNVSYTLESRTKNTLLLTNVSLAITLDSIPDGSIVNLSIGSSKCSETPLLIRLVVGCTRDDDFDAITKLYREVIQSNPDSLYTISAGNEGIDSQFATPANVVLPNTIIVGATDINDGRADFVGLGESNFGAGVNIAAPGVQVYAPAIRGQGNFPPNTTEAFNYTTNFSGTSASAPLVTGVAAILKSIKPELTPAQIKNILISTADPIFVSSTSSEAGKSLGSGCSGTTPPGQVLRGCRLNALKAVQSLLQPPTPVTIRILFPQFNTARYFNIGWSKNNDANFASYKIFRATHPGVTTSDTLVATLTNQAQVLFRDENLAPGTYFYKVFVFNTQGVGSPSVDGDIPVQIPVRDLGEAFGRIFDSSELIFRIPGVPEPGDTVFPPNISVPVHVSDRLAFDCPRSIFDFSVCTGPFTIIGNVIDESGHVSKFRFFPTVGIINSRLNNFDIFEFITHNNDIFFGNIAAADDSYTFLIPEYGLTVPISLGAERRVITQVFSLSGQPRFSPMFVQNSLGAIRQAGSFTTAP